MRHVQVEIDHAGPGHGIASDPRRTIVEDTILIVIAAGRDVHRLARVKRQRRLQA